MNTVGVRELRQHLSAYLDRVRDGERLLVTERNVPVAELVPLRGHNESAAAALVAAGKLIPPIRPEPLELEPVSLRGRARLATEALEYVRGERG